MKLSIYTDGSTGPGNPGPSGYGFFYINDKNKHVNGHGPVGNPATNNAAELMAAVRAIKHAQDITGVKEVEILSDSRYVVDNVARLKRWAATNFSTDGVRKANADVWEELYGVINSTHLKLKWKWIKGHKGLFGNERADTNANLGRQRLIKSDIEHVVDTVSPPEAVAAPVKKEKPRKVQALCPLVYGKRWFFKTNTDNKLDDGRYAYCLTTYPTDKKLGDINLGRRIATNNLTIVILEKPIVALEDLKCAFDEHTRESEVPVIVDMTQVTKPSIWSTLTEVESQDVSVKNGILLSSNHGALGHIVNPPLQAYTAAQSFVYGKAIIDRIDVSPDIQKSDITDQFFCYNEKGKQKIAPGFTQELKSMVVDRCRLTLGIDIPIRRNFLAMLRYRPKEKITVTLVRWEITGVSYRCGVRITHGGDMSFHYAPEANFKFI